MISISFKKKEFILAYGYRGRGHNGRGGIAADKKRKKLRDSMSNHIQTMHHRGGGRIKNETRQ